MNATDQLAETDTAVEQARIIWESISTELAQHTG
jgi:hypothetical protein